VPTIKLESYLLKGAILFCIRSLDSRGISTLSMPIRQN